MRAQSALAENCANLDVARDYENSRTVVRSKSLTSAVMQRAHDIWKLNIRLHLAEFADVHPRTVDHWEAEERQISTEAFLTLLDSAVGGEFIDLFMSRLRPEVRQRWWDQQVLLAKLDRSERKRARVEQESRQLKLRIDLKR